MKEMWSRVDEYWPSYVYKTCHGVFVAGDHHNITLNLASGNSDSYHDYTAL